MGSLLLALRGQGNAVAQSGVKVSGLASSGNRGTCLVAMHYWCRGLYVRGAFPCSEVGRRGWVWVWVPIVPTSGCFYLLHYLPRCSHLVLPPLAPPTCGKRLFSLQCLCFFAGHLFSSICKHPAIFFPSLLSKLQFEFSFSFVFHPTSESDTWALLLFVGYFLPPPRLCFSVEAALSQVPSAPHILLPFRDQVFYPPEELLSQCTGFFRLQYHRCSLLRRSAHSLPPPSDQSSSKMTVTPLFPTPL